MPNTTVPPLCDRLDAVARSLIESADVPRTLTELAARAGLSPSHFQRRFKARFGVSPKSLQSAQRLSILRAQLTAGASVTEAILAAGFGSTSRVYGDPARSLGMPLSRVRQGGRGETIHYACRETAEGLLLMGATATAVCFAEFGESEAALIAQLGHEFPAAALVPCAAPSRLLDDWMQALDAQLRDANVPADLPLDLRGTAFQLRVWQFLRQLPSGQTVTYTDVAEGIGAPRAVRAAASACAANRIAVLIPCHRVLRGDGGLGGYRWGVERKRRLLEREAAAR